MTQSRQNDGFDARWVRIIEATRALFLRYGYTHTSMKAVAEQAHVSKATLYEYWPVKQDLFNSLILWESLRTFDDWLRRVEADAEGEKIGHVLAHGIAAVAANGVLRVLYSRDAQTLGDLLRERGPQLAGQRYALGLDLVRTLQAAGLIRTDLPAEHINHMLTVISVGFVSVGELYDPALFPDFDVLAVSLGTMIQSALQPVDGVRDGENGEDKSIMLEHLARQRQAALAALLALSAPAKGEHTP